MADHPRRSIRVHALYLAPCLQPPAKSNVWLVFTHVQDKRVALVLKDNVWLHQCGAYFPVFLNHGEICISNIFFIVFYIKVVFLLAVVGQ